jgi:hypothetical protein
MTDDASNQISAASAMGGPRIATLTVYIGGQTIHAEPVQVRPGQAAEARITVDSSTGRAGSADIDVFDVFDVVTP